MTVQSDFNFTLRIVKTLSVGGQNVSVSLESAGPNGTLNGTTEPAIEEGWKGSAVAVNGTVEIDLTDLSLVVESGEDSTTLDIDLTGLKILQAEFRTPTGNGSTLVTVSPGDTNGYPIGTYPLEGNAIAGFFRPNNANSVGPTSKMIKLVSLAAATIDILLVAGE